MKNERESPRRNAVLTPDKIELSREAETPSGLANGKNSGKTSSSEQTDSEAGTQTDLPSLRDAIWDAINGIEEKAPGAPIERELVILDRVADGLKHNTCRIKVGSGTMRSRRISCPRGNTLLCGFTATTAAQESNRQKYL